MIKYWFRKLLLKHKKRQVMKSVRNEREYWKLVKEESNEKINKNYDNLYESIDKKDY